MEIAVPGIPIKGILNIIDQKIKDEASLIFHFSADFGLLKQRVEYLQLYLEDASNKVKVLHAPESKLFQRWVTDLRDAAMDAEDLVEICSLQLENDDLDDHDNQRKGISSCIFCVPFSWLSKKVRQLVSYHKIGKQIKQINATLNHLKNQADEFGIRKKENVVNASSPDDEVAELRLEAKFLDDESTSVNIEPKKNEILSLIDQHRVVAVVGMGGSGKTRLLKHVFKSLESSSRYGKCIWLCLSQKFTIEKLQRDVLATLHIQNPEGSQPILAHKVREQLENQNYVVVFDDMWALSETQRNHCQSVLDKLRKIGLPEHSGSRTLVSTRDLELARQLGAEIYKMPLLSTEKSKELLLKHLPPDSEPLMAAGELGSSFDAVLSRCGGLPLAILAVAGALKFENVDEWCSILKQTRRLTLTPDDPQRMTINAFILSYNALNYRAKLCFIFLGVLAEDEAIWAEHLVAMWKGERLVEDRGQGMKILMHLCHRSLLQLEYDNYSDDSVVRMHDVVHDLAVGIAQQSGGGVFEIEALREALLHKQRICRISLAKVPLAPAVTSVSCPRSVRTLRLRQDESLTEIPSQFLANACNLRVLDFRGNRSIERLPINCFKKMRLLKFLDIRGTKIREVPECVRHLTSLEYLGIERDVPVWIGELQCLYIFTARGGIWDNATVVPMPRLRKVLGIIIKIKSGGKKSSNSSRGDNDNNNDDNNNNNNDNNKPELWSWDSFSSQLTHLEQVWLGVEEFEDGKTPPCTLRVLRLYEAVREGGMIMSMPDEWLVHLNNLQHLSLEGINFPSAPPPQYVGHSPLCSLILSFVDCDEYSGTISHLPHLNELRIEHDIRCKNLPAEFGRRGAFPSLTTLVIKSLKELRTLPKLESGAMPRLSDFELRHCMKLEEADGWKEKLRTLPKTGRCFIREIKDDLWEELEAAYIQRQ